MHSHNVYADQKKRVFAALKKPTILQRETLAKIAGVPNHAIQRMISDRTLTTSLNDNHAWLIRTTTLNKKDHKLGVVRIRVRKWARHFAVFSRHRTTKKTLSFLASRRPWGITKAEAKDILGFDCTRQLRELVDSRSIAVRTIEGTDVYVNRRKTKAQYQIIERRANHRFEPKDVQEDSPGSDTHITFEELAETIRELAAEEGLPEGTSIERFIANMFMVINNHSLRTNEAWINNNERIQKAIGMSSCPDHTTLARAFNAVDEQYLKTMFHKLVERLRTKGVITGKFLVVDATHIYAWCNKNKASNGHGIPGAEWGKHCGFFYGYKVHILIDAESELPLAMTITSGSVADLDEFIPLIKELEKNYDFDDIVAVLADAGYDVGTFRNVVREKLGAAFLPACNPRRSKMLAAMKKTVKRLFDRYHHRIRTVNDALELLGQTFLTQWGLEIDIGSTGGNRLIEMINERLLRHMRAGVERTISRLKALDHFERPKVREVNAVRRTVWWCLLSQLIVAWTCVERGTPHLMRRRNIIA